MRLRALSGCAAQTGILAHSGGKRFAIEQERVAAATRTALKQIDLSPLRGKSVDVFLHSMGDAGAGNLSGGRFGLVAAGGHVLRCPGRTVLRALDRQEKLRPLREAARRTILNRYALSTLLPRLRDLLTGEAGRGEGVAIKRIGQ